MTGTPTIEDRRERMRSLGPWFHNLHLPGGLETAPQHPLGDFPAWKWRQIADFLPQDLNGVEALDIGCNAGFYSLELARRGARVTAIDMDDHYLHQARWAAELTGLSDRIRFQRRQVYSLADDGERYGLVLFMGVFYHLRYPLLALDTIYRLRPETLVFQTLTMGDDTVSPHAGQDLDFQSRDRLDHPGWPKLAFIEHRFWNDPTNWWTPNHAAVLALLRSAGFAVRARPGHEIYVCGLAEQPPGEMIEAEWRAARRHDRAG